MSTRNADISLHVRAYDIKLELRSSRYPGFSCITITLAESRESDLPVPRFSSSYMTDEKQAERPFAIGAPNLLQDCDVHIPPNGGIVTNLGRQLDVLYALVGDNDSWQSDILFDAQGRLRKELEKQLDSMIGELDATYKRSPYADFQLMKR